MTAVSWNPQMFATAGANANDIVNLNVNVNISGATVMTDYGGGDALAGWAISVMSGEDAVAGAPPALGSDGSVAFTTSVATVPASFSFAVADDQDDELDGGEMYESSGGMYTHDGLSLAGTAMDATSDGGDLHDADAHGLRAPGARQVYGYTGNVLGGDRRMSDLVDMEVRYVSEDNARFFTRPFSSEAVGRRENTTDSRGAYTFAHLPANMDVVVRATPRTATGCWMSSGLDTYRNIDENGVLGKRSAIWAAGGTR